MRPTSQLSATAVYIGTPISQTGHALNVKASKNKNSWVKKFHPVQLLKEEIIYWQAVNIFISALKVDNLTLESMGTQLEHLVDIRGTAPCSIFVLAQCFCHVVLTSHICFPDILLTSFEKWSYFKTVCKVFYFR